MVKTSCKSDLHKNNGRREAKILLIREITLLASIDEQRMFSSNAIEQANSG
jgi:hypothetical protein